MKSSNTPMAAKKLRCAIYTRKSTDEGLDQEYNSLEAQRDAALAFITSQRHEGWVVMDDEYNDGGFSGGNTNRHQHEKFRLTLLCSGESVTPHQRSQSGAGKLCP